jgi:hypothetical protein
MSRRLTIVAVVLAGCGYRFTAAGGPLPGGVKSIDVPVLKNQTTEPGVEGLLTEELRHRIAQLGYGGSSGERATLLGAVVGSGAAPVAPKVSNPLGAGFSVNDPGIYVVSLSISARLQRGDELLWRADNVAMSERYLPSDDLATMEANRRTALHRLVQALARELVARLTAGL